MSLQNRIDCEPFGEKTAIKLAYGIKQYLIQSILNAKSTKLRRFRATLQAMPPIFCATFYANRGFLGAAFNWNGARAVLFKAGLMTSTQVDRRSLASNREHFSEATSGQPNILRR